MKPLVISALRQTFSKCRLVEHIGIRMKLKPWTELLRDKIVELLMEYEKVKGFLIRVSVTEWHLETVDTSFQIVRWFCPTKYENHKFRPSQTLFVRYSYQITLRNEHSR